MPVSASQDEAGNVVFRDSDTGETWYARPDQVSLRDVQPDPSAAPGFQVREGMGGEVEFMNKQAGEAIYAPYGSYDFSGWTAPGMGGAGGMSPSQGGAPPVQPTFTGASPGPAVPEQQIPIDRWSTGAEMPPEGGGADMSLSAGGPLPDLGQYQMPSTSISMAGLPAVGIRPEDQAILDTYDVASGVTAGARDRRDPILGERNAMLADRARDFGLERDRRDRARAEEQEFLNSQRAYLVDSQAKLREAVANGVDPNRVFANGTVSRLQAAFAGMASALFGDGGASDPMVVLNGIIDRDVQAQRDAIEAAGGVANNALSAFERQLGSKERAEAAYRIALLDQAETQMKALASRLDTVQAKEQADLGITMMQREKAALGSQFLEKSRQERQAALAARVKALRDSMGGGEKPDFKGMTKEVSQVAQINGALRQIRMLKEQWGKNGEVPGRGLVDSAMAGIPGDHSEAAKRYDRATAQTSAAANRAMTGLSYTDKQMERNTKMVDSPFEADHRAGILELEESLMNELEGIYSIMPEENRVWLERQMQSVPVTRAVDPTKPSQGSQVGFKPHGQR